jgi:hypothetical protein
MQLYVAAELGIAGLLLYPVIYGSVLVQLMRAVRQDRERRAGELISIGMLPRFIANHVT